VSEPPTVQLSPPLKRRVTGQRPPVCGSVPDVLQGHRSGDLCHNCYDKRIVDLALAVRKIVLEEAPSASEIVFDANYTISIILTFTGRVKESFCFVTSHLKHVNLVFNRGAELSDPHSLLQGSGKQMRHIQIKKTADLDLPLREYIQLAIDRSFMMGGTILEKPQVVVKVAQRRAR
jgi:hypothetical protein